MPRRHRIGLTLAVALLGYPASGWLVAEVLTRRSRPPFAEPAPQGYEALRLRTADGLQIGAWFHPGDGPTVVLAHGNSASRTRLVPTARAFERLGCTTMAVSLRAHGDSEGERNDIGLGARLDVETAVSEARRRRPGRAVILFGSSAGAAASVFAAAELDDDVDGLILLGPYADLRDAVRRRTERYLWPGFDLLAYGALLSGGRLALPELDRIRPEAAATRVSRRTRALLVAGGDDDRAPPTDARRIARGLAHARVVVAPGMQHEDLGSIAQHDAWHDVTAFVRSFD